MSGYSAAEGSTLLQQQKVVISQRLEDYEVVEDIGSGQFGIVQKVRLKADAGGGAPTTLVWKKINYQRQSEKEKKLLASEVQLLRTLQHPNVVRYVGRINDREHCFLYLLMENCEGGDLGQYLEHTVKKGHALPEELILNWFRQLVNALHYCHNRPEGKVLHRDLKPQNILLCGPERTRIKLADFGLAKMLSPGQLMTQTHVGTPYYMSPEVLARQEYNEKSDVWSLGCLVYEMMTGKSPFASASSFQELCQCVKHSRPRSVNLKYTPELNAITVRMLTEDVNSRPSTADLRKSLVFKFAALLAASGSEHYHRTEQLKLLQEAVQTCRHELNFLEDYVRFQQESDSAIRRSIKLVRNRLRSGQPKANVAAGGNTTLLAIDSNGSSCNGLYRRSSEQLPQRRPSTTGGVKSPQKKTSSAQAPITAAAVVRRSSTTSAVTVTAGREINQ